MKHLSKSKLEQLESDLKSGKGNMVLQVLRSLSIKQIPRDLSFPVANLARRLDALDIALRVLHPIVRPEISLNKPATAPETLEYGVSLFKLGITQEAQALFNTISSKDLPQVRFYQAAIQVSQGDYGQAIANFESHIGNSNLSEYERSVARLNLVAASVYDGRLEDANLHLDPLIEFCKKQNLKILLGNSYELKCQIYLQWKDYDKSRQFALLSNKIFQKGYERYQLFSEKWLAIIDAMEKGRLTDKFKQVRHKGVELKNWQTLRDLDLYKSVIEQDQNLFRYLYFGSLNLGYRHRILRLFPKSIDIGQFYYWYGIPGREAKAHYFDLTTGECQVSGVRLHKDQLSYQLFKTLCSNFYSPFPIANLFHQVFPDEHFNVQTYRRKVYSIIIRLRQLLDENQIPLGIQIQKSSAQLIFKSHYGIKIPLQTPPNQLQDMVSHLKTQFTEQNFSVSEAALCLQRPKRTVLRLLSGEVEKGRLRRQGKGPATRYHFVA